MSFAYPGGPWRYLVPTVAMVLAAPLTAETLAFSGATVHPVSRSPMEGAILLVEGTDIVAIGKDVVVPPGTRIVDLRGKHIYPGFIAPVSRLGLIEVGSVSGTLDVSETGELNSDVRAEVAFNSSSLLLPVAAAGGVLTAHVVPGGGVFSGTSAVMRLHGWTWEDMTVRSPVGMHLHFPQLGVVGAGSEAERADKQKKALEKVDLALDRAADYARTRRASTGPSRPDFDAKLEALAAILDGELPVFIHATSKAQIEGALDWLAERSVDPILVTGPDAQYVAERLASEEVPVILNGVLTVPARRWEPYDAAYTAAARMHEAGVRFCIGDGADASNARNLPFHAAMAVAFGLPREVALRSVTLSAAEILGVEDRLGSLDVGKEASFLITDGDPLEILTRIEEVWIAGHRLDPTHNRQHRLWEKYRNRPRPKEAGR